jgi:hypothetical protein
MTARSMLFCQTGQTSEAVFCALRVRLKEDTPVLHAQHLQLALGYLQVLMDT